MSVVLVPFLKTSPLSPYAEDRKALRVTQGLFLRSCSDLIYSPSCFGGSGLTTIRESTVEGLLTHPFPS